MTVYRFVQLSDMHFGQERLGGIYRHDDVRASLIDDVESMVRERGPANGVLVSGDIAFAGKREEYTLASNWFELLTTTAGCKPVDIFPVPGNHDVDRARIDPLTKTTHASIRSQDVATSLQKLEEVMQHEQSAAIFLDKLGAYADFAESYGRGFESITKPKWQVDLPFPSGHKLRLIGLTSVQVCDGNAHDAEGQMVLGTAQFTLPRPQRDVVQLVMMHYPINWYKDRTYVEANFRDRCRVLITGHEHAGDIQTIGTEAGGQFLRIHSGATNPPGTGSGEFYTYNWLELELRHQNTPVELAVTVFPRIWSPNAPSFQPHYQRFQGNTSKIFLVPCPECTVRPTASPAEPLLPNKQAVGDIIASPSDTGKLVPSANHDRAPDLETIVSAQEGATEAIGPSLAASPASSSPETSSISVSGTSNATTDRPSLATARPKERATMSAEHEANFARLRYFFWKYLDYGQRITVLAQLGLIPSMPTRPLPQTLERQALDVAARRGRLSDVWRAVMERLPADKREPNPFNS